MSVSFHLWRGHIADSIIWDSKVVWKVDGMDVDTMLAVGCRATGVKLEKMMKLQSLAALCNFLLQIFDNGSMRGLVWISDLQGFTSLEAYY